MVENSPICFCLVSFDRQEAMREITAQTGQHFDPTVIETATAVLASLEEGSHASGDWLNGESSLDDQPFA